MLPGTSLIRLLNWVLTIGLIGSVVVGLMLVWFARDLPRPEVALDTPRRPSLVLQDNTGRTYATYGDVVGEALRLPDLPPALPEAVVAVEDRRFWQHHGIDLQGLARAAWVNLRAHRLLQGGSTLTQQVAKNLFLTNARTLRRKVQEFLLTLWLERSFTKQEILEIWLNRVYLGSGAYGVDAAAHIYFGVSARHLNLWQCAVLAGLPRAPSRLNPHIDPAAAAARGREVLQAMVAAGHLTQEEASRAAAEIIFSPPPTADGWFADWAAEQAQLLIPPGADIVLKTTLDPHVQTLVEARLNEMLDRAGPDRRVSQGAVVVLDATNGAVAAMAGGRDYRRNPFNRAVVARRQPGSAFKPFVWLAALEAGLRPDDTVLDAPISIGAWHPENFEKTYLGNITIEDALAHSVNTASVRLLLQAGGPHEVAALAHRLGITDPLPNNDTLALGTGEVGLLELAGAYATFFNGGKRVLPYGISSIVGNGKPVPMPAYNEVQVVDADLAAMMVRMMLAVVSRGTGHAASVRGDAVAGKTGTTQDERDAWFIGAIDGRIIGIWFGNDDARPMSHVTGGGLPAELFHNIATALQGIR